MKIIRRHQNERLDPHVLVPMFWLACFALGECHPAAIAYGAGVLPRVHRRQGRFP